MYLSLSGLGLFSYYYFFVRAATAHFSISVYVCVFWIELPLEFPDDSETLIGKKRRRRTANQGIDLAGVCVYEFVCECVILFVPYKNCHFHFSIVWRINCYLDFNLTSNKFAYTHCLQILPLTMWQWHYKKSISKMKSIKIIQILNSGQSAGTILWLSNINGKQKTAVFSTSFDLYSSNISRFYLPQFYSNDANTLFAITRPCNVLAFHFDPYSFENCKKKIIINIVENSRRFSGSWHVTLYYSYCSI